jgi:hypothetical protein
MAWTRPLGSGFAICVRGLFRATGASVPLLRGAPADAVAPGGRTGEWMEEQPGGNYDRLMERRARLTPLRYCATPDEVAETIPSLITGNPFATGETIATGGSFTATT